MMMKIPSIKRAEARSSEKKEEAIVELGSGYCGRRKERDEPRATREEKFERVDLTVQKIPAVGPFPAERRPPPGIVLDPASHDSI